MWNGKNTSLLGIPGYLLIWSWQFSGCTGLVSRGKNLSLFFFFCIFISYPLSTYFFSFMPLSPFILSPVLLFHPFYLSVLSQFLSLPLPCFASKSLDHSTTNAICQTLRVITLSSSSSSSSSSSKFFFLFKSLLVSSFYLLRFSSSSSTRPHFLIHSSQIHHSLPVYWRPTGLNSNPCRSESMIFRSTNYAYCERSVWNNKDFCLCLWNGR
jgi:hypothetical protein